ncbi:NADP-dependent oxidoreductase [Nonomuraea spiralis]|uniref:NADP-dependent oxidoreductase n=1 Tax=Nonomuraea spiralis TaxID=46182 RepID=A0ABV5I9C6_9ACTN|nr:NADP-dependent oxidoreductase [Nonomuraea spiralis]GGT07247.1 NADPH:quinone reductase [Nonomuraea spiralis]
MKAIRVHEVGGPEVLKLEEVPLPEPGPGEVLVRVHAAAVNPPDWYARRGFANIPASMRPEIPLPFTPGSDVSGVVAALGPGVTEWAEGDEVYGLVRFPRVGDLGGRGYAEYTTAPVGHLARKPASVDHVAAAAVPMAGLTAYQYVHDIIGLRPGSRVLVNGAAGGVGHFAAQLAADLGAYVIAVASGRHETFLKELGVAEFLDYTKVAPEDVVRDVDCLIDTVGGPAGHRFLPVLKDGGTLSPVFHGEYHDEEAARRGIVRRGGQVHSDGPGMAALAELIDAGRLRVGVDSVFSLEEAPRAHERAERGHIQGKIVLRVV